MQGVAGFGVPIAVVVPLLVGLGFSPVIAVAVPTISHSWAATFADMPASFQALIAVTSISGEFPAHWSTALMAVTVFLRGIGMPFCSLVFTASGIARGHHYRRMKPP